MLFDDGDAALLKKWIVKRLEDISDADSDVLADYVLALLRHDQVDEEVKKLCIEQLDDFLREHTEQFVSDVFLALKTKSFISVNSTLAGSAGVSVIPPVPAPSASPLERESPISSDYRKDKDRDERESRGQKRSYFDRDRDGGRAPDTHYTSSSSRGFKAQRRGSAAGPGRWARGDAGAARGGFPHQNSHPQQLPAPENHFVPPPGPPPPMPPFGMPHMPPPPGFPWTVPNPNDPMAAFLAAQAAAWGFPPVMGGVPGMKAGEEKKVVKKVGERCKDYDEKGFCMKGDMCPYEHGMDHIVVPGQEPAATDEYDPNNSQLFPTLTDSSKQLDRPPRSDRVPRGGRGGRGGRGNRSDISGMGPSYDRTNMTLVVEHIPDDKLTESVIREFFTSFGTVTAVDVQPSKRLATVTFERWSMAKKAYDSPAPIFDNRFVKVFWCKSEPSNPTNPTNPNGSTATRPSGSAEPADRSTLGDDDEIDMEEFKRRQDEAQKAYEAKMARKKANEEAAKELEKRTEELLKLQMEEKRKLMEKLSRKLAGKAVALSASPPLKTKEDVSSASPPASNGDAGKPKDEAMTAALKAQLEALEAEARALGIEGNTGEEFDLAGFRGRGRGRGRFTPRGRGAYIPRGRGTLYSPYSMYRGHGGYQATRGRGGTLKLDNRPRKVAISAPDLKGEKDEDFRHYLMNTGLEVEGIEPHPEKDDTQIITFKDRRTAEQFVFTGTEIPNVGTVTLSWYSAPGSTTPALYTRMENDTLDTKMEGDDHQTGAPADHRMDDDSYDLAEDDQERWERGGGGFA